MAYAMWGDGIDGMDVDHIDGDRSNNDPANLQLLSRSGHAKKTAQSDGIHAIVSWLKDEKPDVYAEWLEFRGNRN